MKRIELLFWYLTIMFSCLGSILLVINVKLTTQIIVLFIVFIVSLISTNIFLSKW